MSADASLQIIHVALDCFADDSSTTAPAAASAAVASLPRLPCTAGMGGTADGSGARGTRRTMHR